jgi:hypothetical protein
MCADFRYELLVFEISIGYFGSLKASCKPHLRDHMRLNIIILYKMCTYPSDLYLYHSGIFFKKGWLFSYLFVFIFTVKMKIFLKFLQLMWEFFFAQIILHYLGPCDTAILKGMQSIVIFDNFGHCDLIFLTFYWK